VQPLAPRHVVLEVIPNGVDVEACAGTFGSAETDTLVYAGALSYEANFDAVLYFARSILPLIRLERPGVRLRVTGRATPGQIATLPSAEGIEFTGYLDDVRPTIARSWAEVVPLRKGGGTRLKVLEALALGTPVVSTPKGVQGLEIEAGQHALVADSSAKFAAATVDLLGKPELRQRLAIAGCELVRERYDWRDIGRRFNDLVIQVVPQTGGTQSLISAIDPRVAQRTSEQRREEQASLCIIVVSWNTAQLLARCLESVYAHPPDCTFEVCVVDNASIDGSAQLVKDRFPKVRLIQNQENVGFARANNQAIRESSADFLLLLNSDTLVPGGALDTLLDCMKARPLAGACGPMLVSPNGSFQASYADFPTLSTQLIHQLGLGRWLLGRYYPSHGPAESQHSRVADWVGGASLLVRRHCLNMIGLLDESFFMYGEEMDWCYRMKATGWEVWYCHEARIVHLGGASSRLTPVSRHVQLQQAKVRFFRKHYGVISAQLLSMAIGITSLLKACACLLIVSVANRRSRPKMKTRLRSYLATARMFLSLTPA
jgi:GT2 family glycosyltransferase